MIIWFLKQNSEILKVPSQIKYNPKLQSNEKSFVLYKRTCLEKQSSKNLNSKNDFAHYDSFQLPNVLCKNNINFDRQINRYDITKLCTCKPNEERFNLLSIPHISTKYKSVPCFTLYSQPKQKFNSHESEIIKIIDTYKNSKKEENIDSSKTDLKEKKGNSPKVHNEILPQKVNNISFNKQHNLDQK